MLLIKKRILSFICLVEICSCISPITLCGQGVKFVSFTKINNAKGLSSPNVRKIVEDKYGFVWLATQDGIDRFDGVNFMHFNAGEKKETLITKGSDFHDIVLHENDGVLWSATSNGAINAIDIVSCKVTGVYSLHKIVNNPAPLWYKCLFIKGNALFAGTQQGYVFKLNTGTGKVTQHVNMSSLLEDNAIIDKLIVDENNLIWLFIEQKGIYVLDSGMSKIVAKIPFNVIAGEKVTGNLLFTDILLLKNELLITTNYGIKSISISQNRVLDNSQILSKVPKQLLFAETFAIQVAGDNMYVSNSNGVFKVNLTSGSFVRIINSGEYNDLHWFTNVYTLSVKENRLWLGNQQGVGWVKNIESPYTAYFSSFDGSNIRLNHCYHLFALNDSSVFSCTSDGLYEINVNQGKINRLDNSQEYYQVFKISDGNIIASGGKRMYVVNSGTKKEAKLVYPELGKIVNDFVIASVVYSDSIIFLASQNKKGLYVWNLKAKTVNVVNEQTNPVKLQNVIINSFYIDSTNKLWIIGEDVVSIYDFINNTIEHKYIIDPLTNEPLSILMDICKNKGSYFLAVYGKGIVEIDKNFKVKRIISSASGLSNTGVYKIYTCNDSTIVVSSNDGLFVYNTVTNQLKKISESDGTHSSSFEETSGSRIGKAIFLGGLNGFTKIDVNKVKSNKDAPKCYFSNIGISIGDHSIDTFNIFLKKIIIPDNFTQVTINFSGIYLPNPAKVTFYYKLNELHKEWINLGNQNFVSLIGTTPGTYTLQVKAANEDGVWSGPVELTLIFLPKWYQTWWFKTIIALLLMGILYSLYRYRLAQVKKEQQIRQRIAGDLHDDIGSTLNSIKVFTNLALMKPENSASYLQQLKEGVQSAIVGVRDMVWVLDDKQDTLDHLVSRIEQFISPLAAAQGIQFEKSVDPTLTHKMLKKEEKRNLYLIIKEALNNSIKYAEASTLQLRIEKSPHDKYSIVIHDNGKGFDMETVQKGNGLNNLHYRAQQIKYHIAVNSAPGNGTSIILTRL